MHLPTELLCTTMAPGTVNAPVWLLPSAAAISGLLPLTLLAVAKPQESYQSSLLEPPPGSAWAQQNRDCLAVGPAGAKGNGLFVVGEEGIPANTYLFDYEGELLSKEAYHLRYPDGVSDYAVGVKMPSGTLQFVDAADPERSGLARYMNHDHRRPNVGRRTLLPQPNSASPPRVLMFTKCTIDPGEELCWDYGKGYWDAHPGMLEEP